MEVNKLLSLWVGGGRSPDGPVKPICADGMVQTETLISDPEPWDLGVMNAPEQLRPEPAPNSRRLLARLRDVMAGPEDAESRLDRIVRLVATELSADVCSCYIMRAGEVLELFATVGLNQTAVHRTRLRTGEGIVGDIAAHARPLAVADAPRHPSFAYRPETGEDAYHSMMGVPILRGGRVRGVLAIQHRDQNEYDEEQVELLETIAMVVAELVHSSTLLGAQESARVGELPFLPSRLDGVALAPGLGMGLAVLHRQQFTLRQMFADDPEHELERLRLALEDMHRNIDAMVAGTVGFGNEPLDILESYRMIAEDRGWVSRIREAIRSGLTAEAAVIRVQNDTRARLSHVSDPALRERLLDFDDLAHRLLQHLSGRTSTTAGMPLPDDVILVARSLGPAELLDYDRSRLRGVVLDEGSSYSHVAILARALEIPVLARVSDLFNRVDPLDVLILDADRGHVYLRPGEDTRSTFAESIRLNAIREKLYEEVRSLPPVTLDGVAIAIRLNCGLLIDLPHLHDSGADGIGLFRTEIPFMVHSTYPDVPTQTDLYRKVIEEAGDKPVVFRTLDVGGDKPLPYFVTEEENNPAMGWRAIRIGLDRPAMLRKQVRALLAAAAGRPLQMMFPMVAEIAEFEAARAVVEMEMARARTHGTGIPTELKLGVMLEVPALLFQLPQLLARVDFVAVGSNDLFQYTFACDRTNTRMARRFDPLSPGFLTALQTVAGACADAGVPVSLCGEMAAQPLEAMTLIGLGFRSLSMAPPSVGPIKTMLRSLDVGQLRRYLDLLLSRGDHSLRERLRAFARDHGVQV